MKPTRAIVLMTLALLLSVLLSASGVSQTVTLNPASGPPTTPVKTNGTSFGASETVDLYFDGTSLAQVTTDAHGNFANFKITVPSSALPGSHKIGAFGRKSGRKASAPFGVQTNWSQLGFDAQHTAYNPYENVLNPTNVQFLAMRWSIYGGGADPSGTLALANGVFYVADWGFWDDYFGDVSALDASTGAVLWSISTPGFGYCSALAVAKGVIYAAYFDLSNGCRYFVALDAQTGAVRWNLTTGGSITSPTVANGAVYFGSGSDLYALNGETGAVLWTFSTGGDTSSPAVANGVVYAGSSDGNLYALDAQTGAVRWNLTTGGGVTSPTVANGAVYFGSGSDLYALNANTGAPLWKRAGGFGNLAVANDEIFIQSGNDLYALNANTGAPLWKYTLPSGINLLAVANGVVYIATPAPYGYPPPPQGEALEALDAATGAVVWHPAGDPYGYDFYKSGMVANGMLYAVQQYWAVDDYYWIEAYGQSHSSLVAPLRDASGAERHAD